MTHSILVTKYQRRKAAERLAAYGEYMSKDAPLEELAAAIARATKMTLPDDLTLRNLIVRAFSEERPVAWVLRGVEVREWKPLVLSKPMLEALERAHAWHAHPSLVP